MCKIHNVHILLKNEKNPMPVTKISLDKIKNRLETAEEKHRKNKMKSSEL